MTGRGGCQIHITKGEESKDRLVPFPPFFKETLTLRSAEMRNKGANDLFESFWTKRHTGRGVKILARYADAAGLK